MSRNKEVDTLLLSLGIGGVLALTIIASFGVEDDQGQRGLVVNTEKGCLAIGSATQGWEECPAIHPPTVMAATPESNSGHIVQQSQPSQETAPTGDSVKARLDAKQVGEQFEVTHEDGNRYLVEKSGRSSFKVISPIGEERLNLKFPLEKKKISSRHIIAVQ